MNVVRIFTADTVNPTTGEEGNRLFGEMKDGRELRILQTVEELREYKEENNGVRLVVVEGEYGQYLRLSNKKNVTDVEL